MIELIDGQTIDFDIHKAGDGQPIGLKGLHMHKSMNGKKHKGVDVLFPLDDKEEIEFRPSTTNDLIQIQIINEIQRVIKKDKTKRIELVERITEEIRRYSQGMPSNEQIDAIRRGAERIAKIFSKNSKIEKEIIQNIDKKLKFYISSHETELAGQFFIKQDFLRHRIKISDDLEALNRGNNNR